MNIIKLPPIRIKGVIVKETLHIYTRVSTERQDKEGYSLEYQRELGIKKSKELMMDYIIHNEGSKSSSDPNLENRPLLSQLIQEVMDGKVKHIFVYEFSRLSRNDILSSWLVEQLKSNNVKIYLPSGTYNLSKPIDEFITNIMNSVSKLERQTFSIRSKLGLRKSVENGKWIGVVLPCGYKTDKEGFVVIDKEEKKLYLQLVDWYLGGLSTTQICNKLNENNVPTRVNKVFKNGVRLTNRRTGEVRVKHQDEFYWKPQTLNFILKNPMYYGYRKYKGDLIKHKYPIIDKQTWDTIQELTEKRKISSFHHRGGKRRYFYLLKGMLRCGKCGSNLSCKIKTDERTYYCSKKRKEMRLLGEPPCSLSSPNLDTLNTLVWNVLMDVLINSHLVREDYKKKIMGEKNKKSRIEDLSKQLSGIETELIENNNQTKRLLRLFTSGKISEKRFDNEDEIIIKRIEKLEKEHSVIQKQLLFTKDDKKFIDWVNEFKKKIRKFKKLKDISEEEMRNMIIEYIDEITVLSEKREHIIKIYFNYPIINDKIKYNDPKGKGKKFNIISGNREMTILSSEYHPLK